MENKLYKAIISTFSVECLERLSVTYIDIPKETTCVELYHSGIKFLRIDIRDGKYHVGTVDMAISSILCIVAGRLTEVWDE